MRVCVCVVLSSVFINAIRMNLYLLLEQSEIPAQLPSGCIIHNSERISTNEIWHKDEIQPA